MSYLLKLILSLSLSGTILILMLLALRPIYGKYLSKRWQYYIWLIVIARLLLPITPETSLTGNLLHWIEQIRLVQVERTSNNDIVGDFIDAGSSTSSDTSLIHDSLPVIGDAAKSESKDLKQPAIPENGNPSKTGITEKTAQTLLTVWLIIALLLFMRKITIYQSFVKYVNAGSRPVEDITLLERFGQLMDCLQTRYAVGLYTNHLVSSPLLIGFFHPRIILPSADLSEADFYYTILHELIHEKRRDMFYKWLVQFTLCLHWFNPVVYLMGRESNRLCELSCDERVIELLSENERIAYGDMLLNAAATGGSYQDTLASITLNESKELLKGRLYAIMKYRKIPRYLQTLSFIFAGILIGAAAVLGAYADPTDKALSGTEILTDTTPTADSDSNGNQALDYTIQYEDGTYYILTGGATEADKPISGVTNGYHHLVYVQKDNYSVFGTWNDHEMQSLVKHLSSQFRTLLANGQISQEDVDIITTAATEIQEEYLSGSNASFSSSSTEDDSPSPTAGILDLKRITRQDLPDTVQDTLDSCDSGKWYVIDTAEHQYIYYNGLPHTYAYSYEPQITGHKAGDLITVAISDFETSTSLLRNREFVSDYVLLSFSYSPGIPDADYNLSITYNEMPVSYEFLPNQD